VTELIDEGIEEHHVVKTLLEECASLSPGDDTWVAKMTVVVENVEHHADEEEEKMFPKIRSSSSADDRKQVGERLEARKADLGAPTMADKIDLSKEELLAKAQEQEIPGRSTMSHEELAATVDPR
jgi:hemerythrin superfamily protein